VTRPASGRLATAFAVLVLVAAGGLLVLAPAVAAVPAAGAAGFTGVAEANGVRTTVVASGGPLTSVPMDTGSPVAQATLDSLGSSLAFASQPYPGDEAVTLPGTVAGVTGGKVNLPHYPLIAQSNAPGQPSSDVEAPGSSLKASSSSAESKASATTGGSTGTTAAGLTSAYAQISQAATGTVTALAISDAQGITIGPLRLGHVRSSSTVHLAPDASVARSSALEVTGASVGGSAVGITPAGLTAGSSTTPLPATSPVDEQLRSAGVSVAYLEPESTPAGVVAAGVKVTVSRQVPGPVSPVTVTYIFGQSASAVAGVAGTPPSLAVPSGLGPTSPPPDSAGTSADPAGLPTPRNAPGIASPLGAAMTAAFPSPRPPPAPSVLSSRPLGHLRRTPGFDLSTLYLVLAAGAMAAAALSRLISLFGVKLRWIS
jgi:hypothetical protein